MNMLSDIEYLKLQFLMVLFVLVLLMMAGVVYALVRILMKRHAAQYRQIYTRPRRRHYSDLIKSNQGANHVH